MLKQEMLPQRVRQDIITELRTPDRLREALDVVEIVLGFLSSGGGKANKPLGEYIDRILKMKRRPFSSKVKHIHILPPGSEDVHISIGYCTKPSLYNALYYGYIQ